MKTQGLAKIVKFSVFTHFSRYGIPVILSSLVIGCATAPPNQEMSDARQSVEAAESIGAEKHAPVAMNSAQQLLSRAQDDFEAGEYDEAQKEALAAREAARQAVAISQAKQASAKMAKKEPVPPATLVTEPPAAVTQETSEPAAPKPDFYTVNENDNLWSIAAKTSVYGDPLLWPLILKANADQISNADLILPGLILKLESGLSENEQDAARKHARQRGNSTELDASYLHQYGLR